ncbi:MAG: zinc-dependent metalloprotease [Motilibacteraceae bacterium]
MVDWDLAVTTGTRLVRPGPQVSVAEARDVVAALRRHAVTARGLVRATTGLVADVEDGSEAGKVAVIDRAGWVRANAAGFRTVLEPVIERLRERRAPGTLDGGLVGSVGPRLTGVETGTLLAFLAGKVLGQYELFPPHGGSSDGSGADGADTPGRLLLVAPNIVTAERELGVDPDDFRLWVCVHEETHRVQFGAVPWLRGHVLGEVRAFLDEVDTDPSDVLRRLRAAIDVVVDAVRDSDSPSEGGGGAGGRSLLDVVQTPTQREVLDRLTAVMSLLEGHADHVMDAVGPEAIPSVAEIRERFQRRRQGAGRADRVLRRLLGLESKMAQYRDGARFVRGVVDRVGMAGFNRVWESPATLPTLAEISDPASWVARVHGPLALEG